MRDRETKNAQMNQVRNGQKESLSLAPFPQCVYVHKSSLFSHNNNICSLCLVAAAAACMLAKRRRRRARTSMRPSLVGAREARSYFLFPLSWLACLCICVHKQCLEKVRRKKEKSARRSSKKENITTADFIAVQEHTQQALWTPRCVVSSLLLLLIAFSSVEGIMLKDLRRQETWEGYFFSNPQQIFIYDTYSTSSPVDGQTKSERFMTAKKEACSYVVLNSREKYRKKMNWRNFLALLLETGFFNQDTFPRYLRTSLTNMCLP